MSGWRKKAAKTRKKSTQNGGRAAPAWSAAGRGSAHRWYSDTATKKAASSTKTQAQAVTEAAVAGREPPGQHHQPALAGDHRQPVEGAAHADERGLRARRQGEHVEAVGGDVVGGRGESHQPQHGQRPTEEMRPRQGQRHHRQRQPEPELQHHDPAPLAAQQVHQRPPQRLDHPGQVQPLVYERDLGVGDAQVLVHHHRQRHHHDVGQAFAEVERGDPAPGVDRGCSGGCVGGGQAAFSVRAAARCSHGRPAAGFAVLLRRRRTVHRNGP